MEIFHLPPPLIFGSYGTGATHLRKPFFWCFLMFLMESLGRGYTEGKLWIKFHFKNHLKIIFL